MNATTEGTPSGIRASDAERWPLAILLVVALGLLVLTVDRLFRPENPCRGFPPAGAAIPVLAAPVYLLSVGILLASKRWERGLLLASRVGWAMLLVGIILLIGWGLEKPVGLILAILFLGAQLGLGVLAETSIKKVRRAGISVNRQEGAGATVGI